MQPKIVSLVQEAINAAQARPQWPEVYINVDTGREYTPHHDAEREFVYTDTPRYYLVRGGEGSGKSVSGIIKTLDRLRRGMSGIMVSPTLPHFQSSLWAEFRRWFPWELAHPNCADWQDPGREPYRSRFTLTVKNELGGWSKLICGGIVKPIMFEGPNVHFAYVDELRGMSDPEVIKVLSGRARLVGPNGEPPQLYVTSTTRMHFMYDYFGPIKGEDDPYLAFKKMSKSIQLRTEDNVSAGNLDADYLEGRGATLTEAERRVRLDGEWGEEDNEGKFLDNIVMWDSLKSMLPPLSREPMVIGVDGAVSRDSFAIVGVTRHPKVHGDVAVRLCKIWEPPSGGKIDFLGTEYNPGPETYLRTLCRRFNVVCIVYDEHQLHDMMSRFMREGIAWCKVFTQQKPRLIADQTLYDLILGGRIAHSGEAALRKHLDNAGVEIDKMDHKRRIVKQYPNRRVDAAVALSMAASECLRLNI